MYQIKLSGRYIFNSPNINWINQLKQRYYSTSEITFNRQILENIIDVPNLTHALTFRAISDFTTLTKQTYDPSTQFFNRYHLRAIEIDPTLATAFNQIPNIHLIEVYNMTKETYLLDFSQTGLFWNNSSADNASSPSTRNKFGSAYSASTGTNQRWAQFYYGTRFSSNNQLASSPGDVIRIRVRKYISGNYGVNVVYGETIAELYFLEDAPLSYQSYPTIVDSSGNPI